MAENKNLPIPTLEDLVSDLEIYEKHDSLQFLLNQQPPEKWIKKHPIIKSHSYLPIDKVEYLLRKLFKGSHNIEVLNTAQIFNGVMVTVRIHYKDLVTHEWRYQDGVGACALQTKSGKSPADMANISNGAVSMALPIAKTLAIKDACHHFGKLFGADLNRQDNIPYPTPKAIKDAVEDKKIEQIQNLLKEVGEDAVGFENRMWIDRVIEEKDKTQYVKVVLFLNGLKSS